MALSTRFGTHPLLPSTYAHLHFISSCLALDYILPRIVLQPTPIRASHLAAHPLLPPSMLGFQLPQNLQSLSLAMFCPRLRTLVSSSSFPSLFSLSFGSHVITLLGLNPPCPLQVLLLLLSGCTPACSGRAFLLADIWAPELCWRNHSPRRLALLQSRHLPASVVLSSLETLSESLSANSSFPTVILLSISPSLSFAEKIEAIR